jgi:hypothetical protein
MGAPEKPEAESERKDQKRNSKSEGAGLLPLTPECHHYSRVADVPWDIQK